MGGCVPGPATPGFMQYFGCPRQTAGLLQGEAEEEAGVVIIGLARQVSFERRGGFGKFFFPIESRCKITLRDSLQKFARFSKHWIAFERAAKIRDRPHC